MILSDSVKDGSSIPEAGDEIVTLGYRGNDDAARQSAIILAAYQTPDSGLQTPCIAQYVGINDFNLASHRYSYQAANGNKFVGDFSIIDNGTQTDIQDYIDTVAENLNSSINNSQTDFYKIQLTQASVSVDINDNLNVNVLGCIKHYYGNTVETLENPSQYVSVSLYFNATGETMAATWTDSPANYFRFSSTPHTQNFSTQTN